MKRLYGHEEAVDTFRAAMASGRLHHAWLLTGPRGIGKGLFARLAALRLIAEGQGGVEAQGLDVPAQHQAAKLFEANAHPDFRLVEREVWEKPGVLMSHDKRKGDEEPARSIRVDQIRWLRASLAGTTSLSKRRVVVIDAADDMETSAANALLKSLEEPPASTTFILVSHAPERLLPTIRSRCRQLRLGRLGRADMEHALEAALPEATRTEIAELAEVGEGAPGAAAAWRGLDVRGLDAAMRGIASGGDPSNALRSDLAHALSLKAAAARYDLFLTRAPSFLAQEARKARGPALARSLKLWEDAVRLADEARRQTLDPSATTFQLGTLIAALAR